LETGAWDAKADVSVSRGVRYEEDLADFNPDDAKGRFMFRG
jgi:hypothetical protein